jgi:transposase
LPQVLSPAGIRRAEAQGSARHPEKSNAFEGKGRGATKIEPVTPIASRSWRNRNDPVSFSPHLCRARNLVERFFNKIKRCRRVATRYDKRAANYLALVPLASIRLWLRVNESMS